MALNKDDLKNDLIAALSTSSDAPTKALLDAYFNKLAICITDQIKRGSVTGVSVNTTSGNQNNTAPVV